MKEKSLFVDDWKYPELFNLPEMETAKTQIEALKKWKGGTLYLDYDLDIDRTNGLDLLKLLSPKPEKVYLISFNITGGIKKIIDYCNENNIPCEDIGQSLNQDIIIDGQSG
jgi:hypothetical protein